MKKFCKKRQTKFMYYGSVIFFSFKRTQRRLTRNNKPKLFKYSTKFY
jgi:hypothetical protein